MKKIWWKNFHLWNICHNGLPRLGSIQFILVLAIHIINIKCSYSHFLSFSLSYWVGVHWEKYFPSFSNELPTLAVPYMYGHFAISGPFALKAHLLPSNLHSIRYHPDHRGSIYRFRFEILIFEMFCLIRLQLLLRRLIIDRGKRYF